MRTILIIVITTFVCNPVFSQSNVFLGKDFWATNPSINTIDQKIKEGHDIAEANASNFDGVSQAILQNAPNESIIHAMSLPGNDVNKITHDQRTYIFWAAYKGNVALMKFLIAQGAKTDITDNKGNTILNFAAGAGQKDLAVYDLLMAQGANLQKDLTPSGANALLLVAPHDTDFSLINYFISKGLDLKSVDAHSNGVFNYAAKSGNLSLMKKLLEKDIQGTDTAFIFASQGGRGITNGLDVYHFLEQVGLNPIVISQQGDNPLHALASRSHDVAVISYFLEKGVDVNQPNDLGNTPFMNAAHRNNLEVVTLLSESLENINHKNKKGETALTLAVQNNTSDVVDFLLRHKADCSVLDTNGNDLTTYLMSSYVEKNTSDFDKKLSLLQKSGFQFGKPQGNGNTLYHLALDHNNLSALKLIQPFNADVNAKNNEGVSPLHKAAMKANTTEILKYLVELGAKKELTTAFDETAYDLASENELLSENHVSLEFLKP